MTDSISTFLSDWASAERAGDAGPPGAPPVPGAAGAGNQS